MEVDLKFELKPFFLQAQGLVFDQEPILILLRS